MPRMAMRMCLCSFPHKFVDPDKTDLRYKCGCKWLDDRMCTDHMGRTVRIHLLIDSYRRH